MQGGTAPGEASSSADGQVLTRTGRAAVETGLALGTLVCIPFKGEPSMKQVALATEAGPMDVDAPEDTPPSVDCQVLTRSGPAAGKPAKGLFLGPGFA